MNGNFTFTYADLLALANTTGTVVTSADLSNDENYKKRKAEIEAENNAFTNMVNTMRSANTNLSYDDAKVLAERLGFKYKNITDFENECLAELQKAVNETAREEAYKNAKNAYEDFVKVMGFDQQQTVTSAPVINLNAVVPVQNTQEPEAEIDEAKMTFTERCEFVEDLMRGGVGNSQFKKHLSVRHQNVEAKSIVKDWYKSGYISLAEKNSLLFLCNINACSSHLNVTARR